MKSNVVSGNGNAPALPYPKLKSFSGNKWEIEARRYIERNDEERPNSCPPRYLYA
ncbi:MAG TPA: hypothetical protein VJA87_02610 [Candidatus Paceibacterota bacterium]